MAEANKNVRLVERGDFVRIMDGPSGTLDEVVRKVSVILHMANGMDYRYDSADEVVALDEKDVPEELREQITQLREVRA